MAASALGYDMELPILDFPTILLTSDVGRLQFHMSVLQLLVQNVLTMQGNRIEEALQVFREAQEEQHRADQHERGLRQGDENEQECTTTYMRFELIMFIIHAKYELLYLPQPPIPGIF